jgi:hypothetical protein
MPSASAASLLGTDTEAVALDDKARGLVLTSGPAPAPAPAAVEEAASVLEELTETTRDDTIPRCTLDSSAAACTVSKEEDPPSAAVLAVVVVVVVVVVVAPPDKLHKPGMCQRATFPVVWPTSTARQVGSKQSVAEVAPV